MPEALIDTEWEAGGGVEADKLTYNYACENIFVVVVACHQLVLDGFN